MLIVWRYDITPDHRKHCACFGLLFHNNLSYGVLCVSLIFHFFFFFGRLQLWMLYFVVFRLKKITATTYFRGFGKCRWGMWWLHETLKHVFVLAKGILVGGAMHSMVAKSGCFACIQILSIIIFWMG